jgi:hypothetical protein
MKAAEQTLVFNQQQFVLDKAFWAWFAGFWEGEGSVVYYHDKRNGSLRINIVLYQTDQRPLLYVKKMLGGNVYRHNPGKTHLSKKKIYKWQITGQGNALFILSNMLPYLKFRREEVICALNKVKEVMQTSRFWKETELEALARNYGSVKVEELNINRTAHAIINKAYRLRKSGILKLRYRFHRWRPEEIQVLQGHYGKMTYAEISSVFLPHRTPDAIKVKAYRLGRVKNESDSES